MTSSPSRILEAISVATSTIAVTRTFSVASGSRTFQPNDMSWS